MTFKRLAIIAVLALIPLTASAQKLGMTDRLGGSYVVSFNVTEGEVKVFLPDDMSGGDTVSAAVFAYPKAGSGTPLTSYRIHTDYGSVPVSSGAITIEIPRNMSGSSLRVTLRDSDNREISYSTAAVKLPDAFAQRPETPTAFDFETPLVGQAGRFSEISGLFDGDFSTTSLSLGGSPAHIISESPRKLVFEVPVGIPGQAEIVLIENGVTVRRPFTALRVVKIGEDDSSAPGSIVPEGYSVGQQASEVSVDEAVVSETIVEETGTSVVEEDIVVAEQAPVQESGIVEDELEIEESELQVEEVVETPSPVPGVSPALEVSELLQAQLNLPLEGAANLVASEQIDTVVVRELDITDEISAGEETQVKSSEEEIVEKEIVIEEGPDIPSKVETTETEDASESSKELIESIYKSSTGVQEAPPQEISKPKETARVIETPESVSHSEGGKFTVQVASFRDRASADGFARELERKGYNVRVTEADVPGKGRWSRVSVGSFDTKEQAKSYGERLKSQERRIKSVYITTINE